MMIQSWSSARAVGLFRAVTPLKVTLVEIKKPNVFPRRCNFLFKKKGLILGAFLVLKKSVSPGVKNTPIFKKPSLFVGLCEPPKNTNAMLKNTSFYALRSSKSLNVPTSRWEGGLCSL